MKSKNRASTFLIKSTVNSSFGIGFCIYKNTNGSFLLTCAHVVDACGTDELIVDSYKATLLHSSKDDDTIDLALIYVEGLLDSTPLKLSNKVAEEEDSFTIVGYRPHKNDYAKEPLKGSIKKAYTLESKEYKRDIYELAINDDSIEQVYSGSAVISIQTGLVVAIATDRKTNAKQVYATPARYLNEIWKEVPDNIFESFKDNNPYGREFVETSTKISNKTKRNRILLMSTLFLFLLGVIVVVVYFWKEAQMKQKETQKLLFENTVQQGIIYRDHLNNPLKSKFIFADAISKSTNKVEESNAKMLFSTSTFSHFKLKNIIENNGTVSGIVFSQNEKYILFWGENGMKIFDAQNFKILEVLTSQPINGAIFSQDEQKILSWSQDGTVKLWNINSTNSFKIFTQDFIQGATFSQDGKYILSWGGYYTVANKGYSNYIATSGGELKLWGLDNNTTPIKIFKHYSPIFKATFDKYDSSIIFWSGIKDEPEIEQYISIDLWNFNESNDSEEIFHENNTKGAYITRDKNYIFSWLVDGSIEIRNRDDSTPLQVLKHDSSVDGMVFTEDEQYMLSWSQDGILKLWDPNSDIPLQVFKHNGVSGTVFRKDGQQIVTWSERDGVIKVWENNSSFTPKNFNHDNPIFKSVLSDDNQYILSWGGDDNSGEVKLWSYNNLFSPKTFKHESVVGGAIFSQNKQRILSWSMHGMVKLWDINSSTPLKTIEHNDWVMGAIFDANEEQILSWSQDGILKVSNLNRDIATKVFEYNNSVSNAYFSQDGKKVLFWDDDILKSWNLQNDFVLQALEKQKKIEKTLYEFKWDSDDISVKMWDMNKPTALIRTFKHDSYIRGIALNQDSNMLLAWSANGSLRLWSIHSSLPLYTFPYSINVKGADFSKNGEEVIIWDTDNKIKIYELYKNIDLEVQNYPLKVQVETGASLNLSNELEELTKKEWEKKKKEYDKIVKKHKKEPK